MTALEMAGVSITVLKVASEEILSLVDAPTSAPAWVPSSALDVDSLLGGPDLLGSDSGDEVLFSIIPYEQQVISVAIGGAPPTEYALLLLRAICEKIVEIEVDLQ